MEKVDPSSDINLLDQIDPDRKLVTNFLGTEYRSPLVIASGTLVETVDQIQPYIDAGAGAVIPRSTRLVMARTIHPSPHLYEEGKGSNTTMLNAEWTGAAIDYWRPHLEDISVDKKTIMSVSGRDIEGCLKVCKELDQYNFPLIEINVSCGVSNGVHGYITRDIEHVRTLISSIKEAGITTPISLKLGHSDVIVDLSGVAKEAGADAISAVNTYGPVFDFRIDAEGKPERVMGAIGAKGGLSGNALFHTALTDVAEIARQIDIPVLASGGVTTAERAIKMIMAGASLVQLYTILHTKGVNAPSAMTSFTKQFSDYIDQKNIPNVETIRGSALSLIEEPTELQPQIPIVNTDTCIGCDACVRVCLPNAFDIVPAENVIGHTVEINNDCIGCGHCVTQCPVPDTLIMPDRGGRPMLNLLLGASSTRSE
jgi:dihydroorotate dehydrogenase (NAD+) catalytic subunit